MRYPITRSRHHGDVASRAQHIVEHTGDNRAAELESGGKEAADQQDQAGKQCAMQELPGRYSCGVAGAEDQHRCLRL